MSTEANEVVRCRTTNTILDTERKFTQPEINAWLAKFLIPALSGDSFGSVPWGEEGNRRLYIAMHNINDPQHGITNDKQPGNVAVAPYKSAVTKTEDTEENEATEETKLVPRLRKFSCYRESADAKHDNELVGDLFGMAAVPETVQIEGFDEVLCRFDVTFDFAHSLFVIGSFLFLHDEVQPSTVEMFQIIGVNVYATEAVSSGYRSIVRTSKIQEYEVVPPIMREFMLEQHMPVLEAKVTQETKA